MHPQTRKNMTTIKLAAPKTIDPIAVFVNGAREDAGAHPAALVAMDIGVTLTGGLAVVETKRTFRNDEKTPIEALLSLPVPVHAAFFGLTANIDGRILKGIAEAREEARETYEEAVSEGKTAVLHEELLRGVHALSVGNLAPGGVIEVTTRWADILRSSGTSCGRLRIPMTVGDVYGIPGPYKAPETDEPTHGDGLKSVSLRIRHDADSVRLASGSLRAAKNDVLAGEAPANAPVDIEVEGWKPGALKSKSWDGRDVSLRMEAADAGEEPVRAAVLVDRSGSMSSACEGDSGHRVSKHEAVRKGLRALTEELQGKDRIGLWEFDHTCNPVDGGLAASPGAFAKAIEKLTPPYGGTEIGEALHHVFSETDPCDVLLVTDGKSYALDVHSLAQEGRRVFVVLVGEDSLEANVGHLAALTGGDIHFSFGADVDSALHAVLQGLRAKRMAEEQETPAGGELPESARAIRGNVRMSAAWSGEPARAATERDTLSEGVAAYAASLALPSLSETAARKLAVGEGLVTHLTSLVLVDEEGPAQEGLPVIRKVNLPTPRTLENLVAAYGDQRVYARVPSEKLMSNAMHIVEEDKILLPRPQPLTEASCDLAPPSPDMSEAEQAAQWERQPENLRLVTSRIDWKKQARALGACDLSGLEPAVAASIRALADHKDIREIAAEWGIESIRLAIALVAAWAASGFGDDSDEDGPTVRYAGRVERRLLKGVKDSDAFIIHFSWFCRGHAIIDYALPQSLRDEITGDSPS